MQGNSVPEVTYSVDVGDRVAIRQPRLEYADLAARVGTVVEVFRVPLNSCLVQLDGDPRREREWFFYRDEMIVVAEDAPEQGTNRK
jgi:hypothetical protein